MVMNLNRITNVTMCAHNVICLYHIKRIIYIMEFFFYKCKVSISLQKIMRVLLLLPIISMREWSEAIKCPDGVEKGPFFPKWAGLEAKRITVWRNVELTILCIGHIGEVISYHGGSMDPNTGCVDSFKKN